MLILTRREGEYIRVGEAILITVTRVFRDEAWLGCQVTGALFQKPQVMVLRLDDGMMLTNHIRIAAIGFSRGQVRIGFHAPPTVNIVRGELLSRAELETWINNTVGYDGMTGPNVSRDGVGTESGRH